MQVELLAADSRVQSSFLPIHIEMRLYEASDKPRKLVPCAVWVTSHVANTSFWCRLHHGGQHYSSLSIHWFSRTLPTKQSADSLVQQDPADLAFCRLMVAATFCQLI
ncbi:hypothetical protein Taro_026437 [Colocasia esculenta]|uniref:Uncharacterized protein n=1 Tax=Colocasia esculenta TaxID=4460 RepID=A0A843VBY1_COLES|nr:hypothetical protein [Colocasia esculenta]